MRVGLVAGLALSLTACTGRGGGYLPPDPVAGDTALGTAFTGQAQFGFSFTCEDKGGANPPTGQLRVQLQYSDRGTSLLMGAPFSIHGTTDAVDQVLESMLCIGQNPPPGGHELIFLGRYRLTSTPPPGMPSQCSGLTTSCRFEVVVRDNDGDLAPSPGDFFSIQLSSASVATSELDPATVFYARAGVLAGGNLTVE